jgi:hypothetical protein
VARRRCSLADLGSRRTCHGSVDARGYAPGPHQRIREGATETAAHVDATMKAGILSLYRSAIPVGQEGEPDLTNMPAGVLDLWGGDLK